MESRYNYHAGDNWLAEIKVSSDGLCCLFRLTEREPAQPAPVESETPPPLPQDEKAESVLTLERIYELLGNEGISYGLEHDVISEAVYQRNGEWVVIARGVAPEQGADARVEIMFEHQRVDLPAGNTADNLDYRDKGSILCLEKDTLLARKIPAIAGKAGTDVRSRETPCHPVRDVLLKAGKNTYCSEDGLQVYAAVMGNPVWQAREKQHILTVEPVFVINSDVDLSFGHVRFKGDILVNGMVSESMEIHSQRGVRILGRVTGALIKAEGSVQVKDNVINSKILAGSHQVLLFNAFPLATDFEHTLVSILNSFQQIRNIPGQENVRFGYVLDLLAEKKFPDFVRQVEDLLNALDVILELDFDQEIIEALVQFKDQLTSFLRLSCQELAGVVRLLQLTGLVKGFLNPDKARKSDITVMYCLNSRLEASGSVTVAGQGCFHTHIIARDNIVIKGVVRGGTLKAQKNIIVNKVGSEAGIVTKIVVPKDQYIAANELFENTTVIIGGYTHKFNTRKSRVKIRYNRESNQIEADLF